jgi:hypothetical protein
MTRPWIHLASLVAGSLLFHFWTPEADANSRAVDTQSIEVDPVLGERIAEGVVVGERLWLRGAMGSPDDSSGGLVSLRLSDESRQVHFDRGVVDIEKAGQDLWVLRSSKARELVVSVWTGHGFDDLGRFAHSKRDTPIILFKSGTNPAVLSSSTIRELSADTHAWRMTPLKGKLRSGVQMTAASPNSGGSVYVGFNMGEWGGGLQRIDLHTGAVTNVERRDSKELCAGPLNSDCDPVTGVIADPQNRDCVLASVGLVHMFTSGGRILRICGDNVTVVFEKPATGGIGGKQSMTEAFYGLASAAETGFWAITWRALYQFGSNGPKEYALPKCKAVSGIRLSRDLPGVIVVRTDLNWAVSTSGYTPLVISLEPTRAGTELPSLMPQ